MRSIPTRSCIHAAEAPVVDTSCAALLQLARRVHECGQKVVLTGEGADEWLIGYPWYKGAKLLGCLDSFPGLPLSDHVRRAYLRLNNVPQYPVKFRQGVEESIGGPNAWIDAYGLLGLAKLRFYSEPMKEVMHNTHPWRELDIPLERAKRWDPLNRGVWVAARVTLAGHLLQAKGDRVAMHSSVEVRYPFLDEEVFEFTSSASARAGNCAVCGTSTFSACWPSAGCRPRFTGAARRSSAPRWTASTWTRSPRSWRSY